MAKQRGHRRIKDLSSGGKRSAMAPEEDPGDVIPPDIEAQVERSGASISRGLEAVTKAVKTLANGPGVYRMLDRRGKALYVGKARNLKKRVTTYTQIGKLPLRLQRMIAETALVEVVTTHTEVEALDQIALEQQRLDFRVSGHDFDQCGFGNHPL